MGVVRPKYDALAAIYDARWAGYIRDSHNHVLGRVVLRPGDTLLDVGCGTGQMLEAVSRAWPGASGRDAPRLIGLDRSREMLMVARRRVHAGVHLIEGDAERLPTASATVDVVVSTSAFHYVRDVSAALRECRRVLRGGGRLVLTDWCADYWTVRALGAWCRRRDPAFSSISTTAEWDRLLTDAGFNEVRVERYRLSWFWGMATATAVR